MSEPAPRIRDGKRAFRDWARRRRAGLERPEWSAAVVASLRSWPPYLEARTVLFYLPLADEPTLEALDVDGKHLVIPRMRERPRGLSLHRFDADRLVEGRFGVREPAAEARELPPSEVDLALVPGLAFDRQGGRLGYGRGYYDRLLPDLAAGTPRVGITHTRLIVPRLPRAAHDVAVTHLAHERGVESVTAGDDASRGV